MYIIIQILGVFALFGTGFLARHRGMLSEQGTKDLARLLLGIIYPCLILTNVTQHSLSVLLQYWYMPVITMTLFLVGLSLGLAAVRLMQDMSSETTRSFLFQSMINNALLLPLPIVVLFFGEEGIFLLILSALGSDLILWTLGIFIIAPGTTLRQRLGFSLGPPPIALVIAIVYMLFRDLVVPLHILQAVPGWLTEVHDVIFRILKMIGNGTIPFAFLVAGSRMSELRADNLSDWRIWLVTGIRLILVPAIAIPVLLVLPVPTPAQGVLTVVATMPCAIASIIFSERFGGDTRFVTGTVLLTHMLALVTVPLILAILL